MFEGDDDIALLAAWRGGDRQAGEQLMRTYYPPVLGFFRMRVPDVAEDLTQRTLLACTEGRGRVAGASFRGFVFGVARKMLYKHLKAMDRNHKRSTMVGPPPPSTLTPTTIMAIRQEHWLLLQALQQLGRDQQVVLALHYVSCLRAREIAEAMDVPVSTVTTRLARARRALKRQVEASAAPKQVREALSADLDTWTRSLGPLVNETPASP